MTAHNFRVNATDICLVSTHAELPHENFPYRQPANHLKVVQCKMIKSADVKCEFSPYLSDSSLTKISENWNRVAATVCLLSNPTIELCCLSHRSTVDNHLDWCQYTMRHLCVLGIVVPTFDYVNPTLKAEIVSVSWSIDNKDATVMYLQCCRHCNTRNRLSNPDW